MKRYRFNLKLEFGITVKNEKKSPDGDGIKHFCMLIWTLLPMAAVVLIVVDPQRFALALDLLSALHFQVNLAL